jgi:hypothetical protein
MTARADRPETGEGRPDAQGTEMTTIKGEASTIETAHPTGTASTDLGTEETEGAETTGGDGMTPEMPGTAEIGPEATPETEGVPEMSPETGTVAMPGAFPRTEEEAAETREETTGPRASTLRDAPREDRLSQDAHQDARKLPTEAETTSLPDLTTKTKFLREEVHHPTKVKLTTSTKSRRKVGMAPKMGTLRRSEIIAPYI